LAEDSEEGLGSKWAVVSMMMMMMMNILTLRQTLERVKVTVKFIVML